MSWSVSFVGRAAAVRKAAAEHLAKIKCVEPEESIKQQAAAMIDHALASIQPETMAVKVDASGSQSNYDGKVVNTLNVAVVPFWGWVE